MIGLQGGTKAELDLNALMRKRAAIVATTLRARPVAEKTAICRAVTEHVWPLVADGTDQADRRHHDAAGRGGRRRTAGWRAAATRARSSWSPERLGDAVCRLRG